MLDYHQAVDGLKEAERGAGSLGTTRKGVGPTYSSKASRSGLRVHDLADFASFEARYRVNLANKVKRFGDFGLDGDAELAKLRALAERAKPLITDTVFMVNSAIASGKRVLVEGANAVMLDIDFGPRRLPRPLPRFSAPHPFRAFFRAAPFPPSSPPPTPVPARPNPLPKLSSPPPSAPTLACHAA